VKPSSSILARLWKRWDTRLSLVIVALYALAALVGEWTYQSARLQDRTPVYNQVQEAHRYVPPAFVRWFTGGTCVCTSGHADACPSHENKERVACPFYLFGSDNLGRDVGQRLIQGTRIAFHVGIVTSLIAIPLGVLLGCLGGYFGGRCDSFVVWLCATVASMPGLLFILAIAMVAGKGLLGIYLGIG
jgi:ABC-type dipeptide/oligopeptide/nickel transport system permease subunit